jgi:hypothetical protein
MKSIFKTVSEYLRRLFVVFLDNLDVLVIKITKVSLDDFG